jgi:alpha-tubulin suppressor-like RCC1 family protein
MGGKFKVTNFSYSQSGYLGCAVTSDGKLWCWSGNNQNPYGELGNGTTMPPTSMVPTPVLQSASTPLTNIANVFVDNYQGYTACAIDTNGAVWCWGYGGPNGLLGTGTTNNSPNAVPVQYMGSQLTGVSQMSVNNDHVCALKSDGELICWGNNNYGQIGIGPSAPMTVLTPTLVSNLGMNVSSVSAAGGSTCATDTQGYVWCWGSNNYGILGNGLASSTGNAYVPAKVEIGDAGTQFGGASRVEILYYGYSACALKQADGSIWCWGNYSSPSGTQPNGYFPVQYTEQMVAITGVFKFCTNQTYQSNSVAFVDNRGVFHTNGSSSGQQVSCP